MKLFSSGLLLKAVIRTPDSSAGDHRDGDQEDQHPDQVVRRAGHFGAPRRGRSLARWLP